ncbi:MAG: hypothetical protein PWR11_654 [Bacillota bacterium]|nr:hypothetical protein [Bacillota bacterium]
MRKFLAAVAAVLLLLGVVQPALAAAGDVPSVISFGYEQTRHRIAEVVSWYRLLGADYPDAGVSYSQPLIIPRPDGATSVILMSGNYLNCYRVQGDKVTLAWRDAVNGWESLSEKERIPSRSHTTYVPEENLLVSGTADGWLVFHDLDTGARKYEPVYLGSPDGVVSAPLVVRWQGELVVVAGGKDGNVYIVANFKPGQEPEAFPIKIGGVLTSSPGPLPNGEGFIIGSDGGNKVVVVRFGEVLEKGADGRIKLRSGRQVHAWSDSGRMSGVPASFSMEGNYAYFSDKRGAFYKLDTRTMRPVWINRDFRSAGTFINRSPALDEKYVYFAVQELPGQPGYRGGVVVLDKATGKAVAVLRTGARASTAPAVSSSHIYAGAEDGSLYVWHRGTWQLLGRDYFGSGTAHGQGVLLKGLASEISAAAGLMVFNSGLDPDDASKGVTYIYATADTNLYIKNLDPGVDVAEPGKTYQGKVTIGLDERRLQDALAAEGGVVTAVEVTVGGKPVALQYVDTGTPASSPISLLPGQEQTLAFAWQAADKPVEIVARINADNKAHLAATQMAVYERLLGDNEARVTVKPLLPDLYVKALDPGATATEAGKAYTGKVTFGFKPTYKTRVQAKLTLMHNGYPVVGVNGKVVTFQPGQEQSFSFTYHGAGKDSVLYAKIEPVGSDDADWKDNEKQVTVKANRVDLAVSIIKKPSGLYKGEKATYVARVTSTAAQPITTTVVWSTPGPVQAKRQTITVPAGGSVTTSWSFVMYDTKYGVQVPVFVEVNPNRNQPSNELRWDNNKAMCQVKYLTKDPEPPKDPGTSKGHLIPGDWYDLP